MQMAKGRSANPFAIPTARTTATTRARVVAAEVVAVVEEVVGEEVAVVTPGNTEPLCFVFAFAFAITDTFRRDGNTDRRKIQENKRRRRDERSNGAAEGEGDDNATTEEQKGTNMSIRFSAEEIAAEDRRPKRKVAVLIGYAGTGYKGMQMNHHEKTIEGDLFSAFVAAGAIQKRNADDPKKSSFVRCARTDKGVHAAGNVISLKLTVDDPDIVEKINEQLPEQIRVWGTLRTNNAFNCYQACDSRWYEYLMPSYTLLPPHPQTYLGRRVVEAAKEKGVYDDCMKAWDDVKDYWDEVEKNDIQPILDRLDDKSREEVLRTMHASTDAHGNPEEETAAKADTETAEDESSKKRKAEDESVAEPVTKKPKAEGTFAGDVEATETDEAHATVDDVKMEDVPSDDIAKDVAKTPAEESSATDGPTESADAAAAPAPKPKYQPSPAEIALKEIKAAYVAAKRRYRVTPARIEQLQAALDAYEGTNNFHNYTIQKTFRDPSAKRHIRSFIVNPKPIQIRDTEWLSLKVHGQSFMMHQIRKMVAMAVLCVRCATPLDRFRQSYGPKRISIPKAPGLGLLLERPVFESYSKKAKDSFGKEPLNFDQYEKEIEEFKHRQIYTRIWDTEEKEAS